MQLRADALRFVLAQGLPAVIEVSGGSMEPTIMKGAKVDVVALSDAEPLADGDVVLLGTTSGVLLLHRVMAIFDERGARFVVHQGDARASGFAIAARRDLLARMTGFHAEALPVPTPERLGREARALYGRRRFACVAFLAARRLARALHVSEQPVVRRCAHVYRELVRVVSR